MEAGRQADGLGGPTASLVGQRWPGKPAAETDCAIRISERAANGPGLAREGEAQRRRAGDGWRRATAFWQVLSANQKASHGDEETLVASTSMGAVTFAPTYSCCHPMLCQLPSRTSPHVPPLPPAPPLPSPPSLCTLMPDQGCCYMLAARLSTSEHTLLQPSTTAHVSGLRLMCGRP